MSFTLSEPSFIAESPDWVDARAYPFAHRYAIVAAGRMHYVDTGAPATGSGGPPVLFVHGTPTWSFEFRHLISGLSATHRCIAPDHLGFGLSERPAEFAYTPEAHAESLRELVHALGLSELTLVVHDFGGPIGLPLAFDPELEVARVVLINTWMWSFADDAEMTRKARLAASGFGRLLYRWLNFSLRGIMPSAYGDRRKLTRAIHDQYLAGFRDRDARERVLWSLARALEASSAHYDTLWQERSRLAQKEVRIVWGMKDSAFRPYMLERWHNALPSARVVRVESAGHWPHEEEPEIVLDALREFLR